MYFTWLLSPCYYIGPSGFCPLGLPCDQRDTRDSELALKAPSETVGMTECILSVLSLCLGRSLSVCLPLGSTQVRK